MGYKTDDLVPLLEIYAYEHQRDVGAPTGVVDSLLEAGIPADTIVRILDEMFWRDEVPFQGAARRRLIRDTTYASQRWFTRAVRKGGEAVLKKDFVKGVLEGLARVSTDPEKSHIVGVLDEIRRRFG